MNEKTTQQTNDLSLKDVKSPARLEDPKNKVADDIRRAFIEQQSDIVNEINKSINAEQIKE